MCVCVYIYIFIYIYIQIQIKLRWALFVTYTIIQSIMRSEMCSLHLNHPSAHTWSSGQLTVRRLGSSRGLPPGARIQTHNLGLPWVSSPTLYPLGHDCPKSLLQVRLELTTSALLCCVLPYKYRALTYCATGADIYIWRVQMQKPMSDVFL